MSQVLDAIVVGGGVAGISASVHLADAGFAVTLLEQRKLLGGRAGSFAHGIGPGGLVDSAQHVLVGCCSELQALYAKLGVSHLIRFDRAIEFADGAGHRARMKAVLLPSPFHLTPSFLAANLFTVPQKLQIARGMMALLLAGKKGRESREAA